MFNLRDHGARNNGQIVATLAIQKAIDASAAACGTVVFPAGHYLSKPVFPKSKVAIHLEQGGRTPGYKQSPGLHEKARLMAEGD